jgi:hypothetical protein
MVSSHTLQHKDAEADPCLCLRVSRSSWIGWSLTRLPTLTRFLSLSGSRVFKCLKPLRSSGLACCHVVPCPPISYSRNTKLHLREDRFSTPTVRVGQPSVLIRAAVGSRQQFASSTSDSPIVRGYLGDGSSPKTTAAPGSASPTTGDGSDT